MPACAASYQIGAGNFLLRIKQPVQEVDHSCPSRTKLRKLAVILAVTSLPVFVAGAELYTRTFYIPVSSALLFFTVLPK
jgi:hypothetical protein